MSISSIPTITPALTFKPMSPMLQRLISYAVEESAERYLNPASEPSAKPVAASDAASNLDLRA